MRLNVLILWRFSASKCSYFVLFSIWRFSTTKCSYFVLFSIWRFSASKCYFVLISIKHSYLLTVRTTPFLWLLHAVQKVSHSLHLCGHQTPFGSPTNVCMKSGLHIDVHWTSKGRLMPTGMLDATFGVWLWPHGYFNFFSWISQH